MKFISKRNVVRNKVEHHPAYAGMVLKTNYGVEYRYRQFGWDFFGFFDKKETEWEEASLITPL